MTPCHLPLPGLSGDEPCGKCGQSARLHRNHKEFVDMTIDTDTGRIYPCAKCGTMRTKAEGGTTFTVCDDCWDASAAKSGTSKLMVDPRDARIRDLEEANAAISAKCDELRERMATIREAIPARDGETTTDAARRVVTERDEALASRPHVAGAMPVELRERIASAPAHSGPPTRLETLALDVFAWLQSADVPSEAPRVGPSITREQARAALDWHKRIGGEGFGIAPEWEPVYAMLRACADSEPAPTETAPASLVERAKAYVVWVDGALGAPYESGERILRDLANATPAPTVQVGPAISRSDVREYLDGFGPGRGAVKSRVDKALRAYADGAGEELTDRWDEAIEAADVAVIAAPSALKTSTVDGPVSYYIERGVAQAAIRALKGRGR